MTPHDTPPLALIALFEVSISTRPLHYGLVLTSSAGLADHEYPGN